jgi:hypothetical protein
MLTCILVALVVCGLAVADEVFTQIQIARGPPMIAPIVDITAGCRPRRRGHPRGPARLSRRAGEREQARAEPSGPAITLGWQSRVHVLARRHEAGLELWHPGDLAIRVPGVNIVNIDPGKEPHSAACRPVAT